MEINDASVNSLINYLQQTLSPDVNVRRPAEKFLESVEGNLNYAVLLLHLISKQEVPPVVKIAASVTFKNLVKRNWRIIDGEVNKISEVDRNAIKGLIVGLMLQSEDQIQRQLSEAISIIGREDFPDNWKNLLNEMVTYMSNSGGDFRIINGILQTAHSLFKRYRYEFKSQKLWTEIKQVLENFAKPFTDLFVALVSFSNTNSNNPQALKVIVSSLVLCAKIFNSLNAQDLPEFFEDNMNIWMQNFLNLLSFNNKLMESDDEEEAGFLEQLKSQICENIAMYAQKYHEEFSTFLPGFVETVWNLLVSTGIEPKYDILVSNAIKFLSKVADRVQHQALFQAEGVLDSICSKVIIPNMQFRPSDEEMFEDNPDEYIRRDIEGSDIDTRRRAACDLVKSLSENFESQIVNIFGQYIESMLNNYAANPEENWKNKDTVLYLVTAISVKGATARYGTTQTSELVNVTDFYMKFVKPDLEKVQDIDKFPTLRADYLKYIVSFRNQLDYKGVILPALPLIISHLSSSSIVVHSYAAHAIERLFTMKNPTDHQPIIKPVDIQPLAGPIINGLFSIFTIRGSNENENAMKAIMRALSLLQEQILPFLNDILPKMSEKLKEMAKNPRKPNFNHYLFESLCLCVRIACKQDVNAVITFESVLFPIFQEILVQDVQEFMPYIFQLLSLFLEVHKVKGISENYMQLFTCLLSPILWDRPANISPLVRLLQAFILKQEDKQIVQTGKLEGVLGVFQKLIASKSNDHEGFYLLQSLIQHMDPTDMNNYFRHIFVLLFTRLSHSKTGKFVKNLLVFFSLFAYKYGASTLRTSVDSIQPKMYAMVVQNVFITDVQKVSGATERKICAVGIVKILEDILDSEYSQLWPNLLKALIALFELPQDETTEDDEHFVEIEDTPGYQASYSQLVFAGKKMEDPFDGSVPDAKLYLAQSLYQYSTRCPGKLRTLIMERLDQGASVHLQKYLTAANLSIV